MIHACVTFYQTALGKLDGDAAIKAMNDASECSPRPVYVAHDRRFPTAHPAGVENPCDIENIYI
jgi:hypothetical protein